MFSSTTSVSKLIKALFFFTFIFYSASSLAESEQSPNTYVELTRLINFADNAQAYIDEAENLKANNDYSGALKYYMIATEKFDDPFLPYQTACIASMMNNQSLFETYISLADQKGFWQYYMMKDDGELDNVRNTAAYQEVLQNTLERYNEQAVDTGDTYLYIPDGTPPKDGWPVIVWLHGYRDNATDSFEMGSILTQNKAVFIGLNGRYKYAENEFYWDGNSVESTQEIVKSGLEFAMSNTKINQKKVALMGFSLGAMHSAQLIARYPADYVGGLIISPGGSPQSLPNSLPSKKHLVITYGTNEHISNINLAKRVITAFEKNNQVDIVTHSGGHSFSNNWPTTYAQALESILQ